ncbi:MAG: tetratricopeptide repeat protein [Parabacteroides sp.]|nr:tetratricopeptide repeat protein [Parabacteroides sp.]
MKRILIPLCFVLAAPFAGAQRSYLYQSDKRLFEEGKELFILKNYPGSIDKLEAYKKQAKDADLIQEADYMLVSALYEQGRPDAPERLEEYLEKYPDSRHADEINFFLGSAYFAAGDYPEAISYFNRTDLDMLSPEQQEACSFRWAYSLLQTGKFQQARRYFSLLGRIGRTYNQAAAYYIAYIDYATGDYDNALVGFGRLKENPEYRERALYYMAQIYFMQDKFDKVISAGEALLKTYPKSENNAEIYRITGNSYYHSGNRAQAMAMLDKYVSSTDHPLRGDLYILGVCYFDEGRYKKAVEYLGRTVGPDDAQTQSAYLYLGQAYLHLGDKNNARMAFENAAKAPFDSKIREIALYNYALLLHETNFTGFGESVTAFETFLNDYPRSAYADKANDYLVEVYLTTKNYRSALASIEKIKHPDIKILSAKQDILFQLGTQAFTNSAFQEAIGLFNRAIELGSYNTQARNDAYFWRGEAYYRLGDYEKAASDYQAYLNNVRGTRSDMHALAYYNLGYAYFKLKDYSRALNSFRQYTQEEANQKNPSLADAYNRIGDCLFYNRQFAQAEENYSRAASLQPSAGDYAVYQKAYVQGLQKDYPGKIALLDRLVREFPSSPYVDDALYEKGRAYVLLENTPAAVQSFASLIERFPQSSLSRKAGVQLGLLYYNDNQPEKAVAAYKQVIAAYPGSEEAKIALQDLKSVYIDLNDVGSYAAYANSLGGNVRFETSEQDSLTYLAAEKLFMRGDNEGARRSLANYLQTFPQGAFSPNANYYLASIAFNRKEYAEAERLFTLVLESGDTKFREESLARKAEIAYLQKDYGAALAAFTQLQAVAEDPANREAAWVGIMRSAGFAGKPEEVLVAAGELLKNAKLSPELSNEARYMRAKAYTELKEPGKAASDWLVLSKDTRTARGAEAKYLLAQWYFDSNETEKAEKELMNFIENGTPHAYWLARGFILLADIYISKGDDFQARQYLVSLQNNYKGDDDIAGMIKNRLGKLKK